MKISLFKENVKIALGSIKGQLLRTILTVIIIGIGIMALVGILSGVGALENTIAGNFSSMGANTFNIQRYEFRTQRQSGRERQKVNPVITYRNVKDFEEKYDFPFTKTSISFTGTFAAEVKTDDKKTDPEVRVLGANEHFLENSGLEIEDGRGFNVFDVTNNNSVCVIGADLVKALFKDENPIGKEISVRGSKFKVIGHLKAKGATFGNNEDLRVIIPIQKARSIFTSPFINYALSIKVDKKDMLEGAQDDAIQTFRNIRGLNPIEENNFGIERSDDLLNRGADISEYLYLAAWIISIVTIFGSTIALMNIMLVSVSERTREIGVRKALGAKSRTIAVQFFMETLTISVMGAALGIFLGVLIGWGLSSVFDLIFTFPFFAMTWAIIISFIVAIISGVYPASKASKLDPVESLRYE
ncbi:ABC transporter permease [Winogradskyella litorisediminis]|uniref:ABC transporter permease n=1 Tax=Winogradskyella litorisediminis TaxID=1156618 RepID=A0ABW3NAG5_9FLAO